MSSRAPLPLQEIRTERLVLEPLLASHAPAMFEVLRDPVLYRYLDAQPPASVEHLRDWYAGLERRRSPDGKELWLNWIVSSPTEGPVGYVQATIESSGIASVAFVLSSERWGRGFATEATRAMLEHLARAYGVRRCLATVEMANIRSIRLLERLGFRPAPAEASGGRALSPTERLYVRSCPEKVDPVRIRRARLEDRPALRDLIARSARGLSVDYEDRQVESALATGVFGVDTELVTDGTYFVAEADDRLVGCGGWSRRKTLFGGDAFTDRESDRLDPAREPAKIRAFFVDPAWARCGIGRALLERCEAEARAAGFRRLEMMATLPGLAFYRAAGYADDENVEYEMEDGVTIDFVRMSKPL